MRSIQIELTPEGGKYYHARAFWFLITTIAFFPVVFLAIIILINPFWFRESLAEWFSDMVNAFNDWRNYKQYKIYLGGVDPTVWHTLKGK